MAVRLTAPDGTPTSMIVGFMNMFLKALDEITPDCTIIVFDASSRESGKRAFRYDLLPDYKSNRQIPSEDIRIQMPILQELLRLMGFPVIIREGVEADDVAASLANLAVSQGNQAIVLSSDKDLFQILGPHTRMMRPVKNGVSGAGIYDVKAFVKEYGFNPSSMADYLALIGDKADNIRGVEGIGEKGAKKILAVHPTIEEIFSALSELPKSTRARLESAGQENILWTRDNLIRLKSDIYDSEPEILKEAMNTEPNYPDAEDLAARLGLSRLLKRMGSSKKVLPRLFDGTNGSVPLKASVLVDDYKAELKAHPELFAEDSGVWDFKTAHYLLHPDESGQRFSEILDFLRSSKDPHKSLAEMAGKLQAEIESHEGLEYVMNAIDLPLIPVLNRMEAHGVRLSPAVFEALQSELEEGILQIESQLITETGVRINVNSSQQVSWLLFERLGFTPKTKTKGKTAYSTESSVLEYLAALPNSTVPRLILEHRELSKMLTGFVIPLQKFADSDGIIHTTFDPAMTGTGRLSSHDPNLQNIPAFGRWAEKIKAGLVPVEPGNVFVSADYSQIELRVLAFLSGEGRLIEAFEKGRDIHTETASWVFGVVPELVTPELRRTAKMINFGLLYGMSEFGLAERLNVPRKEAKDIMSRYFAALPGLQDFMNELVEGAKYRGCTRTLAGRIRPVDEIPAKSQALDRALINSPIQGTAADTARRAMINFDRAEKASAKMFLQVHDSIVCECSEHDAPEVSRLLAEIMTDSGGEIDYLEVRTKQGKSLLDV